MKRLSALPLMLALFVAAGLAGCRSQVDELRMRINDAEEGTFSGAVSGEIWQNEQDDPEHSDVYMELNTLSENMTRCNVTHLLYEREGRERLDVRAAFTDIDDLNSILSCAAQQVKEPSVEFERHDGFFWNTFIVRFTANDDSPACADRNDCPPPSAFPRVLLLTVPARVHAIHDRSQIVGVDVRARQVDDNTVRVEVRPQADYRAANLRYFAGRRERTRRDVLKIEVVSRQANYNINTIVSVIGVIFGSGFLIQLSRRYIFHSPAQSADGDAAPPRRRRRAKAKAGAGSPGPG
jgi:hypothetical protein